MCSAPWVSPRSGNTRDVQDEVTEKVGATLNDVLELGGAGHASVMIELATPRPRIELAEGNPGSVGQWRPKGVEEESIDDRERRMTVTSEARRFLEELLGTSVVWLPASQAFVVDVDGDQLRAIARSPFVRAVHLNRRLR